MRFYHVVAIALFLSLPTFSQETRSTLSGAVTDTTGAMIPGAKVVATEIRTGTRTQTVSDEAGQYTIPFLAPGDYQVAATVAGFKEYVRKDVHLGSGDHPVIDIKMEVGDTSASVEVTADVSLIDTEDASTGQAITTKQVEDFPLNGRTPMMLAQLALGVIATGNPSLVHPFDNGAAAAWSIGGTAAQTSELLLDGSPNATWDNRLAYSPPQDSVQEVRVKAFDSDAAYGHTGAGTLNQVMKTGTNTFHGSLHEFNQVSALGANSFFNNQRGLGNPLTHFNQYGATVGGPVLIPKVFNGRNKLFWFFAWENLTDGQPNTNFTTVPTDAEKQGDFSALLKVSSSYQIYNPFSGTLNGNTVVRQPFPGNVISPSLLLNKVAQAYLKYYPEPNVTGRNDGFQNFGNTSPTIDNYDNELGRMDYNMSDRSRMFFHMRHNHQLQSKNNFFSNIATGSSLIRENWGATVDEVYTLNPTTVFDLRFNFTRMNEIHNEPSAGFDPTQLGFPSYIASSAQFLQMPFVGFNGSCGSQTSYQCLGDSGASKDPSQSFQIFTDLVKIKGRHMMKFGTDIRQYRLNTILYGNSAGSYTFSTNWTRGPNGSSAASNLGQDFATFLMGLPTGGQFDVNSYGSYYSYYYAGFFQDDWRIARNLTLNLGIRFEHDSPYSEKYGRTVNGFANNVANPIAAAAIAAYNKNPITQIPVGSFAVPGGLTFASPGNPGVFQNTSHLVSPRIGFAWSPDLFHGKTVIRGGFGLFVQPITIANLAVNGNYSSNPIIDQEGFSQSTPFVAPSNFLTPSTTLSNPFPNGIQQPVGSVNGLSTFAGQTIQFLNPQMKNPYSMRWSFGFQHSLTSNLLLEVVYIGNHSVHLPVSVTQVNSIPRQFLSTLPVRDQTLISALTATTPNPFAGLLPGTGLNNSSTTVSQLLALYPEFPVGSGSGSTGIIEQNNNVGSSYFHSLNIRVVKRLSHGWSLIGNYIHSKLIEQDSWLNDTDLRPEKRLSPFDHPNRFVAGSTYELPIGKGKTVDLRSRWTNLLFGGWKLNGIYSYQTGQPLQWVNGSTTTVGDYAYFGGPLNFNNRLADVNTPAFNTSAFATASTQVFQFHIRTFPTTFANLRQDGINNLDASVLKEFNVTERAYFQLRVEAFNTLNHPTFGSPTMTANNSAFGQITTQANRPRQLQIGARFVF
ncbi:MAG TPA: carboxypeptidase-like regulatory domain-containing protein [Bryobacteraceae bacterium]|nr:carboxypeptidase-like regulatory domain-containing protein [Bryobacteraceae bacterium]